MLSEENEALVTALRNTLMPRMLDRDSSMFTTLLQDLWPQTLIPMDFGGNVPPGADSASQGPSDKSQKSQAGSSVKDVKLESRRQSRGGETTEPSNPLRSYRGKVIN